MNGFSTWFWSVKSRSFGPYWKPIDNLLTAQIQAQMHLTENNIVQLRFAVAQDADEFKDILDYHTKIGTSLSYYHNTMFGPFGATLSYSYVTEKPYFFLNLGFVF